jgi:D-3-phosphoglycerate dehydrogenase
MMTVAAGDAPVCLIVQPIHRAGLDLLAAAGITPVVASSTDRSSILTAVTTVQAVITRNLGLATEAIATAERLRVIAIHGVGTDGVALDAATARSIAVVNTPGVNARSVAEHAIALTFALAKAIPAGDAAARAGNFDFKVGARLTELAGARFGIVGFGAIGQATAAIARALGMQVSAFSRSQPDGILAATGVERCPDLDTLLSESDVVSLHLPLVGATRGLIGARELALMKPQAFLINTGRGGLVDEDALARALAASQIAGAGIDVFSVEPLPLTSPLIGLPNVILTPHMAGSTTQALERTAILAAAQVIDVLAGRRPPHLVNPTAWLE